MEVNNNSDVCIYLTSPLIPVQLFSSTCTKELFGKSEIFNGDIVFDVVNPFPSKGFPIDK